MLRHVLSFALVAAAVLVSRAEITDRCAFEDGCKTLDNPGCGVAAGGWSTLEPDRYVGVTLTKPNQSKLWSLQRFSKGYVYNGMQTEYDNYVRQYCGTADIPLTDVALQSIRDALESCRQNGGTVIPRFAYTWDGYGGCEPDDFEMVITHIRQISAVLSDYADVIPALECGIIGAYGEMHTSRYTGKEHANRIIEAWLRNTPASIRLLIRSCPYIVNYFGAKDKQELFARASTYDPSDWRRIGFYNDGYLGTDADYGTWGSGSRTVFTREEGMSFLEPRGDVPYGGEFATVTDETLVEYKGYTLFEPSMHNLVEEWYRSHLSYLRTFHSTGMTIHRKLSGIPFVAANYRSDLLPDLHEYEGTNLLRFAEDHAGCRLVVRALSLARDGTDMRLDLALENTGFGQLLFPETKEIVLTGPDAAIVLPVTGPDLRRIAAGRTERMRFTCSWPENLPAGEHRLYLRVRLPLADETGAGVPRRAFAFANRDAYDVTLKANYLCTFATVEDGSVKPFATGWFAVRRDGARETVKGGSWVGGSEASRRVFRPTLASPLFDFVRFRGTVPVLPFTREPDFADVGEGLSFAFREESGTVCPYVRLGGVWTRLTAEGLSLRLYGDAALDVLLDFSAVRPTARFTLDGNVLRTPSGDDLVALPDGVRRLRSMAFDSADAMGSFDAMHWGVAAETLELVRPKLDGAGAVGMVGEGASVRFSLAVSDPIPDAYYTPFSATSLGEDFVAEGLSVKADDSAAADGVLELSVSAADAPSKFVRVVVSDAPIEPGTRLSSRSLVPSEAQDKGL